MRVNHRQKQQQQQEPYGIVNSDYAVYCSSNINNNISSIDRMMKDSNNSNNNDNNRKNKTISVTHSTTLFILLPLVCYCFGFISCYIFFVPSTTTNSINTNIVKKNNNNIVTENVKDPEESSLLIQSQRIHNVQAIPYSISKSHSGIYKKQLIESFTKNNPNNLAGISLAIVAPGQIITRHVHTSMHEYFYILSGGIIRITYSIPNTVHNTTTTKSTTSTTISETTTVVTDCTRGYFYHAYPGDYHSFQVLVNDSNNTDDTASNNNVTMLVIGITTDYY